MSLTNEQYDSIIREYEIIRSDNRRRTDEKIERIHKILPGVEALENRIATLSVQQIRAGLDGKLIEADALKDEITMVKVQRTSLLEASGYTDEDLEQIYTCKDCNDTGYLNGTIPKKKCHCFKKREMEILYDQSGISGLMNTENFSKLSFNHREGEDLKRLETAVDLCKDFVVNFDEKYNNIVFCGTVGTGKSFLSCCIAHELLQGCHSVLYMSAVSLFELMAQYQFGNSYEQRGELSRDIAECDLLIIDDLGTEMSNSFVASSLFGIINERFLYKHPTIISTNLDLAELRDRYSERVLSRLTGSYTFVRLTGPDMRQQ